MPGGHQRHSVRGRSLDRPKSFIQINDFMKQGVTASITSHLIEMGFCFVRCFPRAPEGEGKLTTGSDHGKGPLTAEPSSVCPHFCVAFVRQDDVTILLTHLSGQ
jgi:hypothetical protein